MRRLPAVLLLAAALAALFAAPTGAQDEGTLRGRIGSAKARERTLADDVARLGRLERQTAAQVAILEGRVTAAQTELTLAQGRLAATERDLAAARRRVVRLRGRLHQVQGQLALVLRAHYMGDEPDFVTVVLHSDGFPQLLETLSFLHRVERSETHLLQIVHRARIDADHAQRVLTGLASRQAREVTAVRVRRDALAGIAAGLRTRRDQLARARGARLAALTRTRAGRRQAERELGRLLAARAAAARASGPGGPWTVPWAVVQCESGGQNLPPNWASASGYYQMLDSTWKGLGGSTAHAFQAPKSEQDRLAARLWAGGGGAQNWVCAGMVDG